MSYLESDSSDEDNFNENALSDDQDREEVAEALAKLCPGERQIHEGR